MSFGPERIARPVYCYPSHASVPVGVKLSRFPPLSHCPPHIPCDLDPAPCSEAVEVITKRGDGLFHARAYFFIKFAKKIKNTFLPLLCNVAAAKKFCIGELFNTIRPSRLPIRTNIAPRNTIFPPAPKNIRRQELATGYFHVDSLLSMPTTQRADSRSSWH